MNKFSIIFKHELRLHLSDKLKALNTALFFIIVVMVINFTGHNQISLETSGTAALVLSIFLTQSFLHDDVTDGSMKILLLTDIPTEYVIAAKLFAGYLSTVFPLTLIYLCTVAADSSMDHVIRMAPVAVFALFIYINIRLAEGISAVSGISGGSAMPGIIISAPLCVPAIIALSAAGGDVDSYFFLQISGLLAISAIASMYALTKILR